MARHNGIGGYASGTVAGLLIHRYHGNHGAGIGARHQTGRTGLVAQLIQQFGED